MKYKIRAFFEGRNGIDSLSQTLSWTALVLMLLSMFLPVQWLQTIVYFAAVLVFVYAYYRAFSRDLTSRQAENDRFVSWKNRLKQRFQQRKTHKFYRCPKCRTTLRVPKGKGKISITCRCCGEKFIKTT